jgi:hypothetical protein
MKRSKGIMESKLSGDLAVSDSRAVRAICEQHRRDLVDWLAKKRFLGGLPAHEATQ